MNSVFNSISAHDEVIVIDDGSTDRTQQIAKEFNVKYERLESNSGPSTARNSGVKLAQHDLLVFLDSDMEITKSSIESIRKYFEDNGEVQSLTLSFTADKKINDFAGRYKSHYMSFITKGNKTSLNYIYGSYCATRRNGFLKWPEDLRATEDSLWGYKQSQLGYEIHCLHEIEAFHLKRYSMPGLLKNDFYIASYFAKNFLSEKRWMSLIGKESFGHTSKKQMLSVVLSVICFFAFLIDSNIFLPLMMSWLLINSHFFSYILKNNHFYFFIKTVVLYFIINLTYSLGIAFGALSFLTEKSSDTRVKQTT